MTYEKIDADGRRESIPARPDLKQMQEIVCGYIERVTIPGGEMWVNEDGIRLGLPRNDDASVLCGRPIVGNVLVCMRKRATR